MKWRQIHIHINVVFHVLVKSFSSGDPLLINSTKLLFLFVRSERVLLGNLDPELQKTFSKEECTITNHEIIPNMEFLHGYFYLLKGETI